MKEKLTDYMVIVKWIAIISLIATFFWLGFSYSPDNDISLLTDLSSKFVQIFSAILSVFFSVCLLYSGSYIFFGSDKTKADKKDLLISISFALIGLLSFELTSGWWLKNEIVGFAIRNANINSLFFIFGGTGVVFAFYRLWKTESKEEVSS